MDKYTLEYKCRRCGSINLATRDNEGTDPNEVIKTIDQATQFVCPKCNKPTFQDIVSVGFPDE